MAKFFGNIGFARDNVETAPGVYSDVVVTRPYYGDVIRNTRKLQDGSSVNDDITVNNSISIVADAYANDNFFAIRYISWMGALWKVSDVDVQSPRLVLRLGGVYHGTIGTPDAP